MSFLNQFSTHFSDEQKETELYALWSAIGVNTEKALLEEQNRLNATMTDINSFDEDTIRSWLAFFLHRTPFRTSCKVSLTATLVSDSQMTVIPEGTILKTDSGVRYVQMEAMSLTKGSPRVITLVQGARVVERGTYSGMIKVQATNPDLDYIRLIIDGKEVPQASFMSSYDSLSYMGSWNPAATTGTYGGSPSLRDSDGDKGRFYTVVADGTARFSEDGMPVSFRKGDLVVHDGSRWQRSAYTNSLYPIQFAATYVVPRDGYYAYYYGGYLYIKVFTGSEISSPEGLQYELSYISSDGMQGKVPANSLKYDQSFYDIDNNPSELELSNTESTVGVNEPSVGKLGLYLKQRLYCGVSISSVPEYTAWFKAQPEVGDCMVLSNWERFMMGGELRMEATNIVDVYLVDVYGNRMNSEAVQAILRRISPYKDIAVLRNKDFEEVQNYIVCTFSSADDEGSFPAYLKSEVEMHYNISYIQQKGYSLFNDLDLTKVYQSILDDKTQGFTGLSLRGYHYREVKVEAGEDVEVQSYGGELMGGGFYELVTPGRTYLFHEVDVAGDNKMCEIYEDGTYTFVGNHMNNVATLLFGEYSGYEWEGEATLRCYWPSADEGMLPIGVESGIRRLAGVKVLKEGE